MSDTARLAAALAERYLIEREIGAGGMATVYLARDLKHQREVALKVLRPELSAVLGAERFLNEIRISARLDHPHILTLIDSGESDGFLWYVVPYVRGESLRARLLREKQLGLEEALAIARQVAGALDYAHQRGVVHRDIKPENILLHEGEAVLADFGIALAVKEAGGNRLTETGLSLGTPQYMSPEQATGDRQLDARSDVYSLGAVLYEMLAGEPPVTGPTVQAVIAKLMTERPTRLRVVRDTVPAEIDEAVARALSKVPADRFATAAAFAAVLSKPVEAVRPSRHRISWPLVAGVAAVAVIGTAGLMAVRRSAPRPAAFNPQLLQLTTDGNARSPALSPDGSRLAFVARDCDEQERCTERVVVQDTGGAGSIIVLRGAAGGGVSWTTGGRFLVADITEVSGRRGIFAVPALGGTPRFLGCCIGIPIGTTDTLLQGPYLVTAGDTLIWLRLITVSDGLVRDSVPVRRPGFLSLGSPAPAGGRVAVVSLVLPEWTLRLLDRSGRVTDSMQVSPSWDFYHWSPSGDALFWSEALRAGGFGAPAASVLLRRRVGPDGRFASATDTVLRLQPGSRLARVNTDGTALLSQGPVDAAVFALERPGAGRLDFRTRRLVASTAGLQAQLSRDGAQVWLLRSSAEGTGATRRDAMMPFEGGQERPFVVPPGEVFGWDWSRPVSSGLLLAIRDGGRRSRLVEINAATGQVREVAPLAEGTDWILAVPRGGYGSVDVETRSAVISGRPGRGDTTWTLPPEPGRIVFPADVAPDGRAILSMGLNSAADTNWLRRVPLDGGAVTEVATLVFPLRNNPLSVWLPDGSVEYLAGETASTLGWYRVVPGGRPARLGDAPVQGATTWSVSEDGRRVIVVKSEDRPDAYLVLNFGELLRR